MPIIGWFLINWGIGLICGIIYFLFSGLKYIKYVRKQSKTFIVHRHSSPILEEVILSVCIFTPLGILAIFAMIDFFKLNKRIIDLQ